MYYYHYIISPIYSFFNPSEYYYEFSIFLEKNPFVIEYKFFFFLLLVILEWIFYCMWWLAKNWGVRLFDSYYSGWEVFIFVDYWWITIPLTIIAMSSSFLFLSYLFKPFKKLIKSNERISYIFENNIFFLTIFLRSIPIIGFFSVIILWISNLKLRKKIYISIWGSIYLLLFILTNKYFVYNDIIISTYKNCEGCESNIFLSSFVIYLQLLISIIIWIILYFRKKTRESKL